VINGSRAPAGLGSLASAMAQIAFTTSMLRRG
jgi:hypothetical protein